eukprot:11788185-Ditylum_brightwellii.AAC.1
MLGILATINFLLYCAPQNDGVVGCIGMQGVSDQQVELNVDEEIKDVNQLLHYSYAMMAQGTVIPTFLETLCIICLRFFTINDTKQHVAELKAVWAK